MNIASMLARLPTQARVIVRTCIYGLGAGAAAVVFQFCVSWLYRATFVPLSHQPTHIFLLGTLAVILGSALIVGWLLNSFCRAATGSGIPQLKAAFWKDFGYVPWRVGWVKFVAGILSIGGGSSLGREGPSVQLAGVVGSNLAALLGEPKQGRRLGAAAGAAAGLAAAFNTPLAALTFVLEEIVQDLNSRLLGSVLLASVIGAFVVHALVGEQPAFALAPAVSWDWVAYLLVPIVAAAAAVVGVLFQWSTLYLRDRCQNGWLSRLPPWLRPALGALLTWVLGVIVFYQTGLLGVFGLGYDDLSAGLANQLPWRVAGMLLAAKLMATASCYGMGGCGGIFSPLLFLGGMCGLVVGGLAAPLGHIGPPEQVLLAVVGMSACLGAVVRAPVTSILIVFEMTHEFALVPALMVAALISQGLSRRLLKHNFYDAILTQDGHRLEHVVPPRSLTGWHEQPIANIATQQPVIAQSLEAGYLRKLLENFPYERFPVCPDGALSGVVVRREVVDALAAGRAPTLVPASGCAPTTTVGEAQQLLLESRAGLIVLCEEGDRGVQGVVTLHDLLRTELALAEGGASPRPGRKSSGAAQR